MRKESNSPDSERGMVLLKKAGILLAAVLLLTMQTLYFQKVCNRSRFRQTAGAASVAVERPKVALTFDDGPHPYLTDRLLDGLKERDTKATFFMLGENVEGNEKTVKRVAAEGHLIGNHSYTHPEFYTMNPDEICAEVSKTYNLVYELTGKETEFVRPPYGEWKDSYGCSLDMIPVMWTIDTEDWKTTNVDAIVNRVVNHVKENDIILMHDYYETSVTAALRIVDYLKENGYDCVTVDEIVMD